MPLSTGTLPRGTRARVRVGTGASGRGASGFSDWPREVRRRQSSHALPRGGGRCSELRRALALRGVGASPQLWKGRGWWEVTVDAAPAPALARPCRRGARGRRGQDDQHTSPGHVLSTVPKLVLKSQPPAPQKMALQGKSGTKAIRYNKTRSLEWPWTGSWCP